MAPDEKRTHDTTQERLDWLTELRDQALHAGSSASVAKHREAGKLLARERAEQLCDPGSFVELDRYVRHRESNFGMLDRRPYGDAVVTGYGTVFGRRVFLFSQDFTVFGGSLTEVFAEKICKVMDMAVKYGCPLIGINDSGGARIQEGVVSLAGYAEIFWRNVQASGVIPQISLVMGPCAGGAVYSPAMTDFVLMVEGSSYMFITGPDVVKTVTGEEVTFEELGGATTHATKSGVAHLTRADEEACARGRALPAQLPAAEQPRAGAVRRPERPGRPRVAELDTLIPDEATRPYDIKQVIEAVVDDGEFLEVQPRYAENIVCGFARLGGHASGSSATSRRRSPACSTSTRRRRRRGSCAPATRSTSRSSRSSTCPASCPGTGAGVGRDHPPRRQAALRLLRGDGAEADRDHAQGVRRGVRRDELEAHPRRLQLRVADGRGRRDGPGGRGEHHLPQGAGGGRRPRRRAAPS